MKNSKVLLRLMLFFCIAILFFCITDFMALTDILHDYASPQVVDRFGNTFSRELPDWTNTSGEWSMVNLSFAFRFISSFLLMFVLIFLLRRTKETEKVEI